MHDAPSAAALTEQIAEAVRQIITDYALDNESLHASWRCQHPDIYGPCRCVAEFVDSATDTIRARLADSRPAVSEEAVEAAAEAMIQYETNGCCHLRSICGLCDCFRTPENDAETQARELDRARHVLSAAFPLLGDGRGDEPDAESYRAEVEILIRANERLHEQLADAWDEGWNAHARGQVTEARFDPYQWNKNPYRLSPTGDDSD